MQKSIRSALSCRAILVTASVGVLLAFAGGCTSKTTDTAAAPAPAAPAQAQPNAAQPAADQPATNPMSLDDLVAPIALYPDQLLGQILIASMNSQEVLDLGNWLLENQSLKPDKAPDAAKAVGFSTSAQYLAAFPQVVDNMCQELDWTKQLGDAFKADQKGVMAAIQRKRAEAKQNGNLQSSPQMTVDTKTDNGQTVIQIAPADPQVVYVPQYNTQTVYTTAAPTTTTEVSSSSGVSNGTAVAIGLLSFGVGMAVGSALHHDDYYPYPSWGYGGMYYGGRPYYPPPYRPPYYPGYRPGGAYRPPPNYRWNQYNRNVNVKVNNNNYYGRYRNNANNNNRPGNGGRGNNNGYLGAGNANNRPGNGGRGNAPGNSGYLGARPGANGNQRPGAGMANANPGGANGAGRNPGGNRPNGGNSAGSAGRPNVGGAGGANGTGRPANRPANASGGAGRPGGGDRGFGNTGGGAQARPAAQNRPNNGGALGGGNSSGKADRAASNRGRSSMGAPQGGGRPAGGGGAARPAGGGGAARPAGGGGGGRPAGGGGGGGGRKHP